MIPQIGIMKKRCHHYNGKKKEYQQNLGIHAKCYSIHLQRRQIAFGLY
jgi:hypothetical protein